MAEDTVEGASLKDRLWHPASKEIQLPPPLPSELQPSREELTPFIPKRDLYLAPDLPNHGQLHGEETMILTAVILNQAYQDVLARRGEDAAEEFIARIDRKPLLDAAAYHDCGRIGDGPIAKDGLKAWEMHFGYDMESLTSRENEEKRHGPRGAEHITKAENIEELDPSLDQSQIDLINTIISNHTPDSKDKARRLKEKRDFATGQRHIEDYEDSTQLMLRIMQEADSLALQRIWFSHPSYGKHLDPLIARIRDRKAQDSKESSKLGTFVFPATKTLLPLTRSHAYMNRLDPETQRLFSGQDRSGVALETGQKLGILKS